MDIYLINTKDDSTFQFPVSPLESISINGNRKYSTADILDVGEVDLFQKGEKIREISFNTVFPKEYDSAYCRYINIPEPQLAVDLLNTYIFQEEPLRLIITGFNFNELVTLSSLQATENAGESGDRYISITFRTYKQLTVETVGTSDEDTNDNPDEDYEGELETREDTSSEWHSVEYTVGEGDTLWDISKYYYGNGEQWETIYNANVDVIGDDPNLIYEGQVLVIP